MNHFSFIENVIYSKPQTCKRTTNLRFLDLRELLQVKTSANKKVFVLSELTFIICVQNHYIFLN